MDAPVRKPLWFTFGNHMHWVDMEWLWGAEVLPGSARDMLRLCREAGVRGNLNFDGAGYERMAAQHPEALAELRAAVAAGTIEAVGASYGQPYGLFQGGESNVRQRSFGARAVLRLLGARPHAFWEEEFDFFPQLPQLLRGCGFDSACLFFQWTWHTPELPRERASLIQWEGIDGSRLPALPRHELNLHQWPEDFAAVLASPLIHELARPALVQWLELMPSPDWMCRAELLLPRLHELAADPRFELRPRTLSELVRELDDGAAPVRAYTLDDCWHGMSLGKNGDAIPRASRAAEREVLAAEALAALAGLLGRPYPQWDVYPAWELEEAWRELLVAQHHDNHECEGLCGFVGHEQFRRASALARGVRARTERHLAWRSARPGARLVFNRLGWPRDVALHDGGGGGAAGVRVARGVPAFGWRLLEEPAAPADFVHPAFPIGVLAPGGLRLAAATQEGPFTSEDFELRAHPIHPALELRFGAAGLDPLPGRTLLPGLGAGLRLHVEPAFAIGSIRCDSPFAVHETRPRGRRPRKYPSGDWMTSAQWFEEVEAPFTALHFTDLLAADGRRGLLIAHDGSQQFFRTARGIALQLLTRDPWDQSEARQELAGSVWLLPHGPLSHAEAFRLAVELAEPPLAPVGPPHGHMSAGGAPGDVPLALGGPLLLDAPGVVLSAFHREQQAAGRGLPRWAGAGVEHPFVVRMVELDGAPARPRLLLPGPVARAWRTNLMGEAEDELAVAPAPPASVPPGAGPPGLEWSELRLSLRPREIATVMADLVLGRKQVRDLDAKRAVWAEVHRRGLEPGAARTDDEAT